MKQNLVLAGKLVACVEVGDIVKVLDENNVELKAKIDIDTVVTEIDDAITMSENQEVQAAYLAGRLDSLIKDKPKKKHDDTLEYWRIDQLSNEQLELNKFTASQPGQGRTLIGENGVKIRKKTNTTQYVPTNDPEQLADAVKEVLDIYISRANAIIDSLEVFVREVNENCETNLEYKFEGTPVTLSAYKKDADESTDIKDFTL